MRRIVDALLNFVWKILGGIAVIFAGIAIFANFLFTPKLFQNLMRLFSKNIFITITLILIVLAGAVFAWQYFGIPEEKTQLNIEQIENAEIYSDVFKEKVQLIDGRYERRYPEGTSELYVQMDNNNIVFSDLDNDGIKEAVLITYWSGSGSGTWRELTILKNEMGHPFFITSKDLGDRTIINSLTIESGVITIDMTVHGSGDAMCCPTLKKVAKYKLADTELVEIIDETADWKTYRNEKYDIEFQYPDSWVLDDKEVLSVDLPDQTKNFIQINVSNGVSGREDESANPCQPGIAFVVYQVGKLRDSQQAFEEFVNFQIENPERGLPPEVKPKLISTMVGGHNTLKIEETVDNCDTEFYYIEQSSDRYTTISFIVDKNDDKLIINQILSTFRFLE